MSSVFSIVNDINKSHSLAIKRRAKAGNTRAIILTWQQTVEAKFKIRAGEFTARGRGEVQDLLARFGAETTTELIEWAVDNWKQLTEERYMKLPPLPVFADFYFHRERILAAWEESKRTRLVYLNAKPAEPEVDYVPPQKTLTELVEEERRKRNNSSRK